MLSLAAVSMLAGCAPGEIATPAEMDSSYEQALERTAPLTASWPEGSPPESGALARLREYFSDMTAESVGRLTASVYAPAAYLNDNLSVHQGPDAIESYFLKSVRETDELRVEFLDVARTGTDYFIRWQMTIRSSRINGGKAIDSFGMTHFRFDEQGRVLLHKDFWDAGSGLYEYLPVIGSVLRMVRRQVGTVERE